MTTDNKQTGVANASPFSIRQRTQYVKPVQTGNFGRSGASSQASSPTPTQSIPKGTPANSPLLKVNNPAGTAQPRVTPTPYGQPITDPNQYMTMDRTNVPNGRYIDYRFDSGLKDSKGDTLYDFPFRGTEVSSDTTRATESNIQSARSLIGTLSDEEIIQLLQEIEDGTTRGYGHMQSGGDPGSDIEQKWIEPAQKKSNVTSIDQLLARR